MPQTSAATGWGTLVPQASGPWNRPPGRVPECGAPTPCQQYGPARSAPLRNRPPPGSVPRADRFPTENGMHHPRAACWCTALLLSAAAVMPARAQAVVSGVVRDSVSGRPFAGATIELVPATAPLAPRLHRPQRLQRPLQHRRGLGWQVPLRLPAPAPRLAGHGPGDAHHRREAHAAARHRRPRAAECAHPRRHALQHAARQRRGVAGPRVRCARRARSATRLGAGALGGS